MTETPSSQCSLSPKPPKAFPQPYTCCKNIHSLYHFFIPYPFLIPKPLWHSLMCPHKKPLHAFIFFSGSYHSLFCQTTSHKQIFSTHSFAVYQLSISTPQSMATPYTQPKLAAYQASQTFSFLPLSTQPNFLTTLFIVCQHKMASLLYLLRKYVICFNT